MHHDQTFFLPPKISFPPRPQCRASPDGGGAGGGCGEDGDEDDEDEDNEDDEDESEDGNDYNNDFVDLTAHSAT